MEHKVEDANQVRAPSRDNRKATILTEATRIMAERGYFGFGLQELATRCGMTKPGILHHFGSKENLLIDAAGRVLSDDSRAVTLTIDGPATLAGFGNGGPFATGSFQAHTTQTFHGRALAILRVNGVRGAVRIEARAEGVQGASAVVRIG